MKLSQPFEISARLMPAVKVGEVTISLNLSGRQSSDGRDIYEAYLDFPDGREYAVTDLRSGCQGGSVREGMTGLLSFLSAAGEAYAYRERNGSSSGNETLFDTWISEWAATQTDELSMCEFDIEANPDCCVED